MTATQHIYQAWKNTDKPILYNTRDGNGEQITKELVFTDPICHADYNADARGQCQICGGEVEGGVLVKKLMSNNYTDWTRHKEPSSPYACTGCMFTMLLNAESNRCGLMRYSFVAGKTLVIKSVIEMRELLISPPDPPFVAVVAVSQKKHLAIKSAISYSKEYFTCNLEEEKIYVNLKKFTEALKICEALRGIGMKKTDIAEAKIDWRIVSEYGIESAEKITALIKGINADRSFELALFISQKNEKETSECILDLKPKTTRQVPQACLSTQFTKAETRKGHRKATKCGGRLKDLPEEPQSEQLTLMNF